MPQPHPRWKRIRGQMKSNELAGKAGEKLRTADFLQQIKHDNDDDEDYNSEGDDNDDCRKYTEIHQRSISGLT